MKQLFQRTQGVNRKNRSSINIGYLFITPSMVYFLFVTIFPALFVLYTSFQSGKVYDPTLNFGLQNYLKIINDPRFLDASKRTFGWAILSTSFHILLGFILAVLINSLTNHRFKSICRTMIMIPWAIAPVVVAQLARLLFHPQISPIAAILKFLRLDIIWAPLGSTKTALIACAAVNIWHWTPYFMLLIQARLESIDPHTYESAEIDGATLIQQWFHISLPETKKTVLTLAVFDFTASMIYFDLIWCMTAGGPAWSSEILPTYMYSIAFHWLDFGLAASIGMLLVAITMILSMCTLWIIRRV